jgi:hypothetical protein
MKKIIFLIIFTLTLASCESTRKATSQRRGLMIPEVSELPKNKKHYKAKKKRPKNDKYKKRKRRKKR